MMGKNLKVIYLSSTPLGLKMLEFLKTLPCKIVYADTSNTRITDFPEYDLGISFLYTYKIPETEFKKPYKWVNFHPGPLPEMKGRNLAYHAIMNEMDNFGASLHFMEKDFDTGDLIAVKKFIIKSEYTAGDLVEISHALLAELFQHHIPRLLNNEKIQTTSQSGGKYYYKAPINDYVELSDKQKKLIKALCVHPYYHAKVRIDGKDYRIIPDPIEKKKDTDE
jgi:methionyl-tRNA formyltransferase